MTTQIKKIMFLCAVIILHGFININMLQAQNSDIVGAIPGEIDVSPMGAATYTIPIEVPPGTMGMQPNLSIVYNSMSGMGLLGMKWNLSGLSAISRCGQTPYFNNGSITPIQFTGGDYTLDGERLINLGTSTSPEYALEAENFTRIFRSTTSDGYTYFIAYTDDGTIIEYGNGNNSRFHLATSAILSWYISKITDADGNYMTFHYWKPTDYGEVLISQIKYTGNGSMQPFASVDFGYTLLPSSLGKNTRFVSGYKVEQTRLLDSIIVKLDNKTVHKYEFNYSTIPNERTTHLKKITLFGENKSEYLNATTIAWGDQSSNVTTDSQTLHNTENDNPNIVTGDFNGDGYTDYILYGRTLNKNKWFLYTDSAGTFVSSGIGTTHQSLDLGCYFYSADVNGDGTDEVIIVERAVNNTNDKDFYVRIGGIYSKIISDFSQIFFGDFDGDGKTDILVMKKEEKNPIGYPVCKFEVYMYKYNYFTTYTGFEDYIPYGCKVRLGDFRGCGKTDVELLCSNGDMLTYCYNTSSFAQLNLNAPITDYHSERYSGDFNGDGISDLLVFSNNSWKVYFAKGGGAYTDASPVSLSTQQSGGSLTYKVLIADLDGDGKDDIIQLTSSPTILYSKGYVNEQYLYQKEQNPSITLSNSALISDINSDGMPDLIGKSGGSYNIYHLHKNKQYDTPTKITDGLGKEVKIKLKPRYLPANNLYISLSFGKKYFYFLPDEIQISNGVGTAFNSFSYEYEDPKFSILKRSFLGFKEFVSINHQEKKKDIYGFRIDSENTSYSKHVLVPTSHVTFYNTTQFLYAAYGMTLESLTNHRYVPYLSSIHEHNYLSQVRTVTANLLNNDNRLEKSTIQTEVIEHSRDFFKEVIHTEEKKYSYQTIKLNGNQKQKKTVTTKIIDTQTYHKNGVNSNNTSYDSITFYVDTLTFIYDTNTANKGHLLQERKGNSDGSITTTYSDYNLTGGYCKKKVSAQGCEAREETYTYNTRQQFITQVQNPLGYTTKFTYDSRTGNKLTETDLNGLITRYSYDSFGNLTKIVYPDNTQANISMHRTASVPKDACYYTKTVSDGKPELRTYYDKLGREVCRMEDKSYHDTRYTAAGQVEKTSYPYTGINTSDQDKIWHHYSYDNFGRKSRETAPYIDLEYNYVQSPYPALTEKIKTIDHLRGTNSWKEYDALGRIVSAEDAGGTIEYKYEIISQNNKKRKRTAITANGITTTILADLWGNRLSIIEPNAGTISSTYNKFNELVEQTDARGNITTYQYDKLGRVTKKQFTAPKETPQVITYIYDGSNGKGKIAKIKIDGTEVETFTYDNLSRLAEHKKIIDGSSYKHKYTYNKNGQLETLTYPSGFAVTYKYTLAGELKEIRQSSDNTMIYEVAKRNKYHSPTICNYGNGLTTGYGYNPYGLTTYITTGMIDPILIPLEDSINIGIKGDPILITDGYIQHFSYEYDNKGLMVSRSEKRVDLEDLYKYDLLDRLTVITSGKIGKPGTKQMFTYAENGNIKSGAAGTYLYKSKKPHAVTEISASTSDFIENHVEYNFYNQPTKITGEEYELELSYGADQQRQKMEISKEGRFQNKYYYISKYYEREKGPKYGIDRHYHYIYGDNGVVALHTRANLDSLISATDSVIYPHERGDMVDIMYYIHTDRLGSYCAITNTNKEVRQRNFFDAWGNVVEEDANSFPITNRGFTGHEHYPYFKIINMNGRLYDPVIARFFSPDNFVQIPEFTQSFNRYSYCLNNPLKYTDPSGMMYWKPDKKGNLIAEQGDNEHTLAKFLNTTTESAMLLLMEQGYSITKDGFYDIKTGNRVTLDNVFTRSIANSKSEYTLNAALSGKKTRRDKKPEDNYNCWGSAIAGSQGQAIKVGVGIPSGDIFDNQLNNQYVPISADDAKFGLSVLRFANGRNEVQHGAVFYGKSKDGTIYVYTKNGWELKPEVMRLLDLQQKIPSYGTIQGIYPINSGYYNPKP